MYIKYGGKGVCHEYSLISLYTFRRGGYGIHEHLLYYNMCDTPIGTHHYHSKTVGPMGGIDLWPKHGTEVTAKPPTVLLSTHKGGTERHAHGTRIEASHPLICAHTKAAKLASVFGGTHGKSSHPLPSSPPVTHTSLSSPSPRPWRERELTAPPCACCARPL